VHFIPFPGISKTQEGAPLPGSIGVAKVRSPGAGEVSSASEYFSCVSSPGKLIHGGKELGSTRGVAQAECLLIYQEALSSNSSVAKKKKRYGVP
jgi:hypothetical protein